MKKRMKTIISQIIVTALSLLMGILLYEYGTPFIDHSYSFLLMFAYLYISVFLQMIIHEAGHLVFGLLTGYQFSSFRIGSFMWIRQDGVLRIKKYKLAGTGGQCLLSPPDLVDGTFPVVLYNLGGALLNVIAAILCCALYYACRGIPALAAFFVYLAIVGFFTALTNGIPMQFDMVNNDGYNAFSMSKDNQALRAFWLELKVNEQVSTGMRLKDMPEAWFALPSDEAMTNSMIATIGVMGCNRLIDEHRFDEANQLIIHFEQIPNAIVGLHRNLLVCDRIFCELIGDNRREILDKLLTKQQKKFMKSMKKFPSVLRTEYAYALLAERNNKKATKLREQCEKLKQSYPYLSDIQSEEELMNIADKVFEAMD